MLGAQTPPPAAPVPEPVTITAEAVARHLAALAHDSLQRRATPSPALERTARYVAAQLQAVGAQPGDRVPHRAHPATEDTIGIERFPLPGQRRLDAAAAGLTFTAVLTSRGRSVLSENGTRVSRQAAASFVRTARVLSATIEAASEPVVLVAGRQSPASLRRAAQELGGQSIALYLPPRSSDSATVQAVRAELARYSRGVVVVGTADSAAFAVQVTAAQARPPTLPDDYMAATGERRPAWLVELAPAVLPAVLRAAGVDWAALQSDTTPVVRLLPLTLELRGSDAARPLPDTISAPNVLGTIEGSDSVLRRQYLVVAAPMDQGGSDTGAAATAADNRAGLAGLIELARALNQPGARPRRSVVFVATSGDRRDGWGSRAFAIGGEWHARYYQRAMVALTLELGGGAAGDSLVLAGLSDFSYPVAPSWTAALHPELGVTVLDGGTAFEAAPGPAALARLGMPSLVVTRRTSNGVGASSAPSESPASASLARVLRLLYYVIEAQANAPTAPQPTDSGRERRFTQNP